MGEAWVLFSLVVGSRIACFSTNRRLLRQFEPSLRGRRTNTHKIKERTQVSIHVYEKEGWKEEETAGEGRGKGGKKSPFLAPSSLWSPIVGSFHDFETIEFQDVLRKVEEGEGVGREVRHYANYIMNPSDVKEKEKMPVDSLGSFHAMVVFSLRRPMEFRHGQREKFREDASFSPLLPPTGIPVSLSEALEPFEFKPRSYLSSCLLSGYIN